MDIQTCGNSWLFSNHLRAEDAEDLWPLSKHTATDQEQDKYIRHLTLKMRTKHPCVTSGLSPCLFHYGQQTVTLSGLFLNHSITPERHVESHAFSDLVYTHPLNNMYDYLDKQKYRNVFEQAFICHSVLQVCPYFGSRHQRHHMDILFKLDIWGKTVY